MEPLAALRAFVKVLVLPPAGPLLIALAGLLLLRRAPRVGRLLAWAGVAALAALSTPIVAWLLARPFDAPAFDPASAHGAQAVVILSGGLRRDAPEYGGDTLGRLTAERVRYGARVARATGLPVLVTGGAPRDTATTEAGVMRDALEQEYGVPVRWVEDRSRNTRENAARAAPLLRADGVTRVVLVAHAFDVPRAAAEFRRHAIEVVPAPTGLTGSGPLVVSDFIPTAPSLLMSYYALYEHVANAALALGL